MIMVRETKMFASSTTRVRSVCTVVGAMALLNACGLEPRIELANNSSTSHAIAATCTADVAGIGVIDAELDYLPHVIACENGAADFEALRAQAVAARSYLAYKAERSPGVPIADGTSDQVYSCANAPLAIHYEAVASTSGETLRYRDTTVAAFYVAGAIPTSNTCVAAPNDNDPTNTQHYVTVNEHRVGDGLEQTTLGFVAPSNFANRGAHSQNGADCLAENGRGYDDILRFYYGVDIEVVRGDGDCVIPDSSPFVCGALSKQSVNVRDVSHPCFVWGCASDAAPIVIDGAMYMEAGAVRDCLGRQRLSFSDDGVFAISLDLEEANVAAPFADGVRVRVQDAIGVHEIIVDEQDLLVGEIDIGVFSFSAGRHQWIEIDDAVTGASNVGRTVVFPAVIVRPSAELGDGGVVVDAGVNADAGADGGSTDTPDDDGGMDESDDAGTTRDLPRSVESCQCVTTDGNVAPWTALVVAVLVWGRRSRRRQFGLSDAVSDGDVSKRNTRAG